MVIKTFATDDNRKMLCDRISRDFYKGRMPYRGYKLIDICLYDYLFSPDCIYDLFATAQENKLLFKFDFLDGLAEYGYQNSTPTLITVCGL